MTYDDINPQLRAFLGYWEGFRKLGFASEDIFCGIHFSPELGQMALFCTLKTQGKDFNIIIGPLEPGDQKRCEAEYVKVTKAIIAGEVSPEVLNRIWDESFAFQDRVSFLGAIMRKGIRPPVTEH